MLQDFAGAFRSQLKSHNCELRRTGIMGGFLGQVQRGRAAKSLRLGCGLVAAVSWLGLGVAGGQVPAASTPAGTPSTVPSGVTPAQAQSSDDKALMAAENAAGLTTSL